MTDLAASRPAAQEDKDLPPMVAPSSITGLRAVLKQRYLLRLLVQREIKARYQGSVLGLLWSYINPLSQFCIYFFVMGTIFALHRNIPNFAIHIFAAIIIVHFFTETMMAGTRSIVRNRQIVQKMAMPREMFPVATMLTSLYHVGPQLLIIIIAATLSGWRPDIVGVVAFVMAIIMIAMLGIGIALLLSAANVFFRDVASAVAILSNLIRFGVPMIYSYEMVTQRFGSFADYYLYNPIADAVLLFQRAFWVGSVSPDSPQQPVMPDHLLVWGISMIGVSAVILALGQLVFSRYEAKIPERL